MNSNALSVNDIQGRYEKALDRFQRTEAEVDRAQEELDFWRHALSVFEEIQARDEGRPVAQIRRAAEEPRRRGLYKGSAAFLIVHYLNDTKQSLTDEEIIIGLQSRGWEPGKSTPEDAVDRAIGRLVERDYVIRDESGRWAVTKAGLTAARITSGSAPTGGALEPGKEDHDGTALTD